MRSKVAELAKPTPPNCRDARVYGHTTTAMHDIEYTPPKCAPPRSEYNLLTSGGGVINLWSVVTAAAKQLPSQANSSVDGEGAFSVLQHKHVWRQPMQKVLFAPVGQVCLYNSYGSRGVLPGLREQCH